VSKTAQVVALLQREHGASLGELVDATGWLPHTTRAALTGLKKKGHLIASEKIDEVRRYRITGKAA
jgi:DNA-binding transcriptional regulator PaaX